MADKQILRLHWKLFFPLVGLLWLIIGITISYSLIHEKQRQRENLENRLLNVNNTVIEAYGQGADLQKTVDFIKLFTDDTTLNPLRISVYDEDGNLIADNKEATISFYDDNGDILPEFENVWNNSGYSMSVHDVALDSVKFMVSSKMSSDGKIHSFAALPYEGEVTAFLSIDPMVWTVVVILGILSSGLAYLGARALSRNVYTLQGFARAIASDQVPDEAESWHFSKDELGDVSRNLLTLYRDKIHAEHEKIHHERQLGINVSHELNTPVGIIKGYLDTVLSDDNMPEEIRRRFLTRAQQTTDRLANLVNDVKMVMRLQENGDSIECAVINFHDFVSQLAEDIAQGHVADNMEFVYDIPDDCRVVAHESLLTNSLLNLIYNAVQHSGGSRMSLQWLRRGGDRHFFAFADDGEGVDEEHLGRLFDLFYRVDSGRSRKNGGAGLGLPLVHRTIIAMGGTISVENASPSGLCFKFSLPAG